jgi:tetratricopeptide (TPR) repeat protein
MADQRFEQRWNEFWLDLHFVHVSAAKKAIEARLRECRTYRVDRLRIVFGTPDWYPGSIAHALHEILQRDGTIARDKDVSRFENDPEAFSRRSGSIVLQILGHKDALQQDASMGFKPFDAGCEKKKWCKLVCENWYYPLKEWYLVAEIISRLRAKKRGDLIRKLMSQLPASEVQVDAAGRIRAVHAPSLRALCESFWQQSATQPGESTQKTMDPGPPVVPAIAVAQPDAYELWKAAMLDGMRAFKSGDYAPARTCYEKALAVAETSTIPRQCLLTSLNNLGLLQETQSRYSEAEKCYARVLALVTASSADFKVALKNIAYICHCQGKFAEADALLQREEEQLDPKTEATELAWVLIQRALTNRAADSGRSVDLLRRAISALRPLGSAAVPQLAAALRLLGSIYYDAADYSQARMWFTELMVVIQHSLAIRPAVVTNALKQLGEIERMLGDLTSAEERFRKALEDERARGAPPSCIADTLN